MDIELMGDIREFREIMKRWRKSDGDCMSITAVESFVSGLEKKVAKRTAKGDEGHYCPSKSCFLADRKGHCTQRCVVAAHRDLDETLGKYNRLDYDVKMEIERLIATANAKKTAFEAKAELSVTALVLIRAIERSYGHDNGYLAMMRDKIVEIRDRYGLGKYVDDQYGVPDPKGGAKNGKAARKRKAASK